MTGLLSEVQEEPPAGPSAEGWGCPVETQNVASLHDDHKIAGYRGLDDS